MKKGFTLIELITVLIIVGILAAIALPQFGRLIEASRGSEARTAIDAIRTVVMVYYIEYGRGLGTENEDDRTYIADQTGLPMKGSALPPGPLHCLGNDYYFMYYTISNNIPNAPNVEIVATRCTNNTGKPPAFSQIGALHMIVLLNDGSMSEINLDGNTGGW